MDPQINKKSLLYLKDESLEGYVTQTGEFITAGE